MSKLLTYWILPAILSCAAILHGCESSPSAPNDASTANRVESVRLTQVPPPPGIPPQALTPISEDQRETAELPLDDIVASITPPRYLANLGSEDPADSDETETQIDPPLAAQKFYAVGRQALLDGDNFAAVQAFDKALRLSPNEASILRGLGQAWARAGNRVSAANHYRQAFAADPTDLDSIIMLGRFAIDNRRWNIAILNFDTARQLADERAQSPTAQSDAQRLTRFYLANALNQAGYARAAVGMYEDYLVNANRRSASSTRYGRELSIIDAQQGETLSLIGDLYHRLDEPPKAIAIYEQAGQSGVLNPDTLRRRMLYTRLRMGQSQAAESIVAEAVAYSNGESSFLELIRYAVAQGVPVDRLSGRLTQLYEDQGEPAALALALADVLPPKDAANLLSRHLQSHPGDDAVFGKLLSVSITEPLSARDRATLIDQAVTAMTARPELADRYAQQLIANLTTPADLLVNFPAYEKPAEDQASANDPPRLAMTAFLHGQLFAATDQPDAAAQAYRAALDHSATLVSARVELAAYHIDREEYETAEELLASLGDAAPARATELRVKALTQAQRYEDALMLINQSLQRAAPGSPLMLDKAALLLQLDRAAEAERTLLDALNARPTDESIYAALLELYNDQTGMQQNQVRLVRRMIETIPNARITRLIRVEYLLANRNYRDALQLINLLDQSAGDEMRLIRMHLEAFIGLKQPDQVLTLLEQHLDAAGDSPDNDVVSRALTYLRRSGEREKSLPLEERFWNTQAASAGRSMALGEVYFLQEKYAQAVGAAREALALNPGEDDLAPYVLLIQSLFKLERGGEAEQALATATQEVPEDGAGLFFFAAMLYDEAGDTAASRRVMEDGLKKYPNHPSLNNTLGYGLANEGIRLDEARLMIERALATQPGEAAYLDSLGWVYYKLGELEKALGWLEKSRAAQQQPNPVILDHLGDTLYRLGREAEAVRAWNRANMTLMAPNYVKLDPEEEGLEDRLSSKIKAVADDAPAPVAPLGQGIELPLDPPEILPAQDATPAEDASIFEPAADQP